MLNDTTHQLPVGSVTSPRVSNVTLSMPAGSVGDVPVPTLFVIVHTMWVW
ncbi:MAG TPA: hypothetical protein VGN46_13520 [Luteibacter sp.]